MAKSSVNIKKVILLRISIAFGLMVLFAFAIVYKVFTIQVYEKKHWKEVMKDQSTRIRTVKANRGNIFAADGSLLATSIPKYDLHFDPRVEYLTRQIFEEKLDSLAMYFAKNVGKKSQDEWRRFLKEIYNRRHDEIVAKELPFDLAKSMEKWPLMRLGRFKSGFWKEEKSKRLYFMGDLARRSIGYSKEGVYVGLEGAFDSMLQGHDGKMLEQRYYGGWKTIKNAQYEEPQNGFDIVTTLDVNIQDVAQHALRKALIENNADYGCAIVMDVKTGQIKAMANLKDNKDGQYVETQNFAVDDYSEPGSTFKLMSVLALLEGGFASNNDSVDIEGGTAMIYGEKMVDASHPNKRYFTLQESFEKSSNVGISKFVLKAYGKNPSKFVAYAKKLRLNEFIPFDIKAKSRPYIKTPGKADWYSTTLPWMSIGYETKMSPLQILTLYNAVANNGVMMKPYMVKDVLDLGKSLKKVDPEILVKSICSPQTLEAVKRMMEGVVDHGTATNLKGLNYTVAGKTGTAQISEGGKGYNKATHKASFVGYFPAEDPQYTCIVVVNNPKKGIYYGSLVAGPVFKEIADKVYSMNYQMQKPLPVQVLASVPTIKNGDRNETKTVLNLLNIPSSSVENAINAPWVKGQKEKFSLVLSESKQDGAGVPNVLGMGLKDALYLLENKRLNVKVEGYGKVVSQSISPGAAFNPGSTVTIRLNN